MLNLSEEITESEKTRSEFLRWKLVGVAGLGAAGLGLSSAGNATPGNSGFHPYFLLLLIPPVCFYVDLLCRHISLRILMIGAFLRQHGSYEERQYHKFVKQIALSEHFLGLESLALEYSTMALSASILFIGRFPHTLLEIPDGDPTTLFWHLALAAGFGGIGAELLLKLLYRYRASWLDADPKLDLEKCSRPWTICAALRRLFGSEC